MSYQDLGLYLAFHLNEDEMRCLGILECCPRRRTTRGRPPTMTGSGIKEREEERFKPWHMPENVPDAGVRRTMFKEALRIALKFVMGITLTV